MNNPISTQRFPLTFDVMPAEPGYNAALQHFQDLRETLKQHVFRLDKAQTVVVKPKMMTHPPGRVKPAVVSVSDAMYVISCHDTERSSEHL